MWIKLRVLHKDRACRPSQSPDLKTSGIKARGSPAITLLFLLLPGVARQQCDRLIGNMPTHMKAVIEN